MTATNMSRGKGTPYYGKLMTESLPSEVKRIWYSRDDELPELPQHKWSWQMQTDLELVEQRELLFKILADAPLTDREMLAVKLIAHEEVTFREAAKEMGITNARTQQIYRKAMQKLRRHQAKITGTQLWEVDCHVTTWRAWKVWAR